MLLHETTTTKDPLDLYGKYQKVFIDNYFYSIRIMTTGSAGEEFLRRPFGSKRYSVKITDRIADVSCERKFNEKF